MVNFLYSLIVYFLNQIFIYLFICKGRIENDYEADGSGSFLAGASNWNGVENSGDGDKKAIKVKSEDKDEDHDNDEEHYPNEEINESNGAQKITMVLSESCLELMDLNFVALFLRYIDKYAINGYVKESPACNIFFIIYCNIRVLL